jgi:hypothetical protein
LEHVPGSVVACASEDDGRAPDHSSRGDRGFADSPLEEAGFELAVPRRIVTLILVFAYVTPST